MGMFPSKDFANFSYRLGEDQRLVHLHGWWRAGPKNFAVPGIRLSEQRPTLILSSLITSSSAFWLQSLVLGLMALQTVLKHSKGLIFFPLSPLSPRSWFDFNSASFPSGRFRSIRAIMRFQILRHLRSTEKMALLLLSYEGNPHRHHRRRRSLRHHHHRRRSWLSGWQLANFYLLS